MPQLRAVRQRQLFEETPAAPAVGVPVDVQERLHQAPVQWMQALAKTIRDFTSLRQAKNTIEQWRYQYNDVRPHSALNYATPSEFAAVGSASFAVGYIGGMGTKPRQGNPGGLASLGLDPASSPCEGTLI